MPAVSKNKGGDLRGRRITDTERERIKILAATGLGAKLIAQKMGRSQPLIQKELRVNAEDISVVKGEMEYSEGDVDDWTYLINRSVQRLKQRVNSGDIKTNELVSILRSASEQREREIARTNPGTKQMGAGGGEIGGIIAAFAEFTSAGEVAGPEDGGGDGTGTVRTYLPEPPADLQDL